MNYANLRLLIHDLTKTNTTDLPSATLNLYTQPAENRIVSLIMQSDGRWQWDDTNSTDLPIGTFTLVASQQDYSLATTHLKILGVSVKDNTGIWHKLKPIDTDDIEERFGPTQDRSEYFKTAGMPQEYDLLGNSIFLYPAPDAGISVTLTSGGKIYFQRGALNFDYSTGAFTDSTGTTSSSPGFNSLYHDLIAYWASYNYCVANGLSMAAGYMNEIQRKEASLIHDYSKRNRDERQLLTMKSINFR